jgi:sugar lactone lactonase YvrE
MRNTFPAVLSLVLLACSDDTIGPRLDQPANLRHSLSPSGAAVSGIMITVAGGGFFSGDGELATGSVLRGPTGIAVDAAGNLYIADGLSGMGFVGDHRIRKVSAATGIITTVAGTGVGGYSGDGGPSTSAGLNSPRRVAFDASGNLYIADQGNHRIRRVDAVTEIITTAVGNGVAGSVGDGGSAIDAQLTSPRSVTLDASNNLYIAESNRIRMVSAATGIITTVAGSGIAGFNGEHEPATNALLNSPRDVAFDAIGNLYIADLGNHRIRMVSVATGLIATVAGTGVTGSLGDGGPAIAAQLAAPIAVAFDGSGNLYIADALTHQIRAVDAVTGNISTIAGTGAAGFTGDNGPAISATLNFPTGLAFDAIGNLYIADVLNSRIRAIGPLEVAIDIKPGSPSGASITPGKKGKTPVAIMATAAFDINTVVVAQVRFGRLGTEASAIESRLSDIDSDGYIDLVLYFPSDRTGIVCGDTSAILTGKMFSGKMIRGSESIRTVGCK